MKKISSLLLAAAMLISLAACGGNTGGTTETPAEPATEAPAAETDEPAGEDAEPDESAGTVGGELNIAVFEGGYGSAYWETIVDMFEEANPGVTVNMQISPTIGDIIRPQIVAGNVPDFIVMTDNDQSGVIVSLIKENALLDITDVFDGPGVSGAATLREEVLDGSLESAKCSPYGDGRVYLAPFTTSPMGMVYNNTIFEQHDWDVPVTWDDFFALGDAAKEEGIALFTYQGIYPSYLESILFPAIASAAGIEQIEKITSYQEGAWNNPAVIEVMENLQRISTDGYLMEGTVALNHTQSQTDMMVDKALFIPNGVWMEGEMEEAPRSEGFTFGITPAPVNEGNTRYVMTSLEQFSIPKEAANPELAKEFLRFLYSDESVKLFSQESNGIYALKKAYNLVDGLITEGTYNMLSVYDDADAVSIVVGFDALPSGARVEVQDEIFNPISDIMNGTMTAQQWAENLEEVYAEIRDAM